MFSDCNVIKNINELEFLDTSDVIDFSNMFDGCSSPLIKDLKSFPKWNVSNGKIMNLCSKDVHRY